MAIALLLSDPNSIDNHVRTGVEFARRVDQPLIAVCLKAPEAAASAEGKGNGQNGHGGNGKGKNGNDNYEKPTDDKANGSKSGGDASNDAIAFPLIGRKGYAETVREQLDAIADSHHASNHPVYVVELPPTVEGILEWLDAPLDFDSTHRVRTLLVPLDAKFAADSNSEGARRVFEQARCATLLVASHSDGAVEAFEQPYFVAAENSETESTAREIARALDSRVFTQPWKSDDETEPESGEPEPPRGTLLIGLASRRGAVSLSSSRLWNEARKRGAWTTIVVANPADSPWERFAEKVDLRIRSWFAPYQLDREARKKLSNQLETETRSSPEFILFMSLATLLACIGLVQNSAAVVIGAMLVAPLMTPLLGAGMALIFGNDSLFRIAIRSIGLGVAISLLIGVLFGLAALIFPLIQVAGVSLTPEMIARSYPNVFDPFVGLAAGIAGGFAIGREGKLGTVAGVAIAAALVPPLATAGLQLSMMIQLAVSSGNPGLAWECLSGCSIESFHQLTRQDDIRPATVFMVTAPLSLFLVNACTAILGSQLGLRLVGMHRSNDGKPPKRWVRPVVVTLWVSVHVYIVVVFVVQRLAAPPVAG